MPEGQESSKLYRLSGQELTAETAENLAREEYLQELQRTTRANKKELAIEIESADRETSKEFILAKQALDRVLQLRARQLKELTLPERVDTLVADYRKSPEEWQKQIEKSGKGLIGWAMRETYQRAAIELGIVAEGSNKEALLRESKSANPERRAEIVRVLEKHLEGMLNEPRFAGNGTLQNSLLNQVNNLRSEFYNSDTIEIQAEKADEVPIQQKIEIPDPGEDAIEGPPELAVHDALETTTTGEYEVPIDLRAPETTESLMPSLKEGLTASRERYDTVYTELSETDQKHIHLDALYALHETIAAGLTDEFITSSIKSRFEVIAARIESQPTMTPELQAEIQATADFHALLEGLSIREALESPESFTTFAKELKSQTPTSPPELQIITAELLSLLAWQRGGCSVVYEDEHTTAHDSVGNGTRTQNLYLAALHAEDLYGPQMEVLQQYNDFVEPDIKSDRKIPSGDIQFLSKYASTLLATLKSSDTYADPNDKSSASGRKAYDYCMSLSALSPELLTDLTETLQRSQRSGTQVESLLLERLGYDFHYNTTENENEERKAQKTVTYWDVDTVHGRHPLFAPHREATADKSRYYTLDTQYMYRFSPHLQSGQVDRYADQIERKRFSDYQELERERRKQALSTIEEANNEGRRSNRPYHEQKDIRYANQGATGELIMYRNQIAELISRIPASLQAEYLAAYEALVNALNSRGQASPEDLDTRGLLHHIQRVLEEQPRIKRLGTRREEREFQEHQAALRRKLDLELEEVKRKARQGQLREKLEKMNERLHYARASASLDSTHNPHLVGLLIAFGKDIDNGTFSESDFINLETNAIDIDALCPDVKVPIYVDIRHGAPKVYMRNRYFGDSKSDSYLAAWEPIPEYARRADGYSDIEQEILKAVSEFEEASKLASTSYTRAYNNSMPLLSTAT